MNNNPKDSSSAFNDDSQSPKAVQYAQHNTLMDKERQQKLHHKLDNLARISDSYIQLPGNIKIGLDSIIGLIPVVGDIISSLLSLYIVAIGLRARVPKLVLGCIAFNIIIDSVLGSIPFIGDVFDIFFRANERNVNLLKKYVDHPQKTTKSLKLWIVLFGITIMVGTVIFLSITTMVVKWMINLF